MTTTQLRRRINAERRQHGLGPVQCADADLASYWRGWIAGGRK